MIRVNHYGVDATCDVVQSSLAALGAALGEHGVGADAEGARRAAAEAWQK